MVYNPNKHRRSIRLKGYDYSQAGAYFITIVTQHRACLFGQVVGGEMRLSDAGRMVGIEWMSLPHQFPRIELDVFVVMPNHVHGIIVIIDDVGAGLVPAPSPEPGLEDGATTRVAPTLGDVIGAFKSRVTVEYIHGVKTQGWPPFHGRLWQRNYYEHIIRDEESLNHIREYLINNPLQWEMDRENPNAASQTGQPMRIAPTGEEPWRV